MRRCRRGVIPPRNARSRHALDSTPVSPGAIIAADAVPVDSARPASMRQGSYAYAMLRGAR